ncbi:rRNA methyltransferase [Paenibacillus sp. FSL R5-0490]|uniref:rRNA methyltransferase n=1 Tax=Bacillales TaxID=1385 RepID=UPI00096D3344|nr:rRNA methyltransferase [Paenibacillus sp. FSL R5-0490]OMF62807.1 rRNA methyltransferase [Paenibacillus sp. FSL R5-0490]
MWELVNGKLIQKTDENRVKFRTNISKSILNELETLSAEHDTHINYLLESGLQEVLNQDFITYDKKTRPKDRVQYKTTYDKVLLEKVKDFANNHGLFINDVIEYSVRFINLEKIKNSSYKNRVE